MSSNRHHNNLTESGFTLLELIITISIMGILSTIGSISFRQWIVKSRVEAQVRQMTSDISELRVRALTTKQRHSFTLNATSYVFKSYSSENESKFKGTVIPGGTHNVAYGLKKSATADYGGEVYLIYESGLLESITATVFLDYAGSAALDCLIIHTVRANPGKKTGATCNDK